MTTRRQVVVTLGAGVLAMDAGFAQQPRKVWRIGLLQLGLKSYHVSAGFQNAFLQGMREHGLVLERDFIVEERFAEGELARLPVLAAELVRMRVDLILTGSTQANRAAQQATSTIPIVIVVEADPVGNGFAVSLARPGKNMTGLSTLHGETIVKNLESLVLTVPRLSRIGLLKNPSNPGAKGQLATLQAAAQKVGVTVLAFDASDSAEIEVAIATMQRERVQAFVGLPDTIFSGQSELIARLALKHRLPSSYVQATYPEKGGLMSYGQDLTDNWRRSAKFIDKIFKGAKPSDLPFEQPTVFEFVVNLNTAKALGLKIPQSILIQATKVIE